VQWLCGDDDDAKSVVAALIGDAGYEPVGLGGTATCAAMEAPRRPGAVYGEEYRATEGVVDSRRVGRFPGRSRFYSSAHMKARKAGHNHAMVTVALGVLIGACIVLGLLLDWVRHPDLIPVPVSQRREEALRAATRRAE
jgi:hypothetical protein